MLNRLTDRCFSLPHEERTDRPELGFIRGDRFSVQVDAGASGAHAALMAEALRAAGLPEPSLCLLTHSHWDHTFGLHALPCPALCRPETDAALRRMARWRWSLEDMAARLASGEDIPFCHEHILVEYPDRQKIRVSSATLVVPGEAALDLGGVTVRYLPVRCSHAPDCAVVYVPGEGVVFLGDSAYADMTLEPETYHAPALRALMETLRGLDYAVAVCGHQQPMDRAALEEQLAQSLAQAVD